jgi:hypothetical protein
LADGHKVARVILAQLALGMVGNDGRAFVARAILVTMAAVNADVQQAVVVELNEQPTPGQE